MTIPSVTQEAAVFNEWQHPGGRPREHYTHLVDVVNVRQGYGGTGVYVMPDLDPDRRAWVAQCILQDPDVFIAQEALDFSKHMVFNDANGTLESLHIDLRVFAIQDGNGKVTVFPGGLTRVARPGGRITNNASGGLCKPTWVAR